TKKRIIHVKPLCLHAPALSTFSTQFDAHPAIAPFVTVYLFASPSQILFHPSPEKPVIDVAIQSGTEPRELPRGCENSVGNAWSNQLITTPRGVEPSMLIVDGH